MGETPEQIEAHIDQTRMRLGGNFRELQQQVDDALDWRGRRLLNAQIDAARRDFAHSFGSCSFEEPVSELREAGLLP